MEFRYLSCQYQGGDKLLGNIMEGFSCLSVSREELKNPEIILFSGC